MLSGGFYGNLLRRAFTGDLLLGGGLLLVFFMGVSMVFYGRFHGFLWGLHEFLWGFAARFFIS